MHNASATLQNAVSQPADSGAYIAFLDGVSSACIYRLVDPPWTEFHGCRALVVALEEAIRARRRAKSPHAGPAA
jgi:hypothetical protein